MGKQNFITSVTIDISFHASALYPYSSTSVGIHRWNKFGKHVNYSKYSGNETRGRAMQKALLKRAKIQESTQNASGRF